MAIFTLLLQIFVPLIFRPSLIVTASSEASVTCSAPVGLASGDIPSSALSSSSCYSDKFRAENSRFNIFGAWKPKENDSSPWLQIKLNTIENITQVGTRGRYDADEWINTFSVSYSVDGETFTFYENKVFSGNQDRNSIVINVFPNGFRAQYVRIYPKIHTGATAMRVELYKLSSCAKTCVRPLGMENRNISNSQVTSSTKRDSVYAAWRARLNLKSSGQLKGAWSSFYQDSDQWLQVNFEKVVTVTRIATQGRQDENEWVKAYSVSLYIFLNGSAFTSYRQGKNLTGNQDRNTVVINVLRPYITSERVRIHPTSWYGRISMRVEFYECKEVLTTTQTKLRPVEKLSRRSAKAKTTKKPRKKRTTRRVSAITQPKTRRTTSSASSMTQPKTLPTTPKSSALNVSDANKGDSQQYEYRRPDGATVAASVTAALLAIASLLLIMYALNRRRILERSNDQEKPTSHVSNGITLDNRPASTVSIDDQRMDHFYQSLLLRKKEGRTCSRKYQGLTSSYDRESSVPDTSNRLEVYSYANADLCGPTAKRNSHVVPSKPCLTNGDAHNAHHNPGCDVKLHEENKEDVQNDVTSEPVYESLDRAVHREMVSEETGISEPSYDVVEGPDPEVPEPNVYSVLEGPDPDDEEDQTHIYAAVDNGEVVSDDEISDDRTYDDLDKFKIIPEQQTNTEDEVDRRMSVAI